VTAKVSPFGDGALLVEVDDVAAAHRLAGLVESERAGGGAPAAVEEWVVGFGNLVVHLDPESGSLDGVEAWLSALASRIPGPEPDRDRDRPGGRRVVIPVTFDGPDLGPVATGLGVGPRAVVDALCGVDLPVAFLGFAPGFPYLVGLPPGLASVPRRPTPRPSVPAGSVALAGGFASVYPQATPGGWPILGRTSLPLFDREQPPYALLRAGDAVCFVEEREDPAAPGWERGEPEVPRPLLRNRGPAFAEVVEPGLLSLVEDGGRRSTAALGVPRAGPADPGAMRLANRLVGNPDGAAAVEATALGPTLRFTGARHLAVVAVDRDAVELRLDGRPVASGVVLPVASGQEVAVGRIRAGLRAYLAVSGGFDLPLELGSRSSDVLCGLGHGPLRTGDRLDLGPPTRPHGVLAYPTAPPGAGGHREVRVLPGPHRLAPIRYRQLLSRVWTVGEDSNRVGIRLLPADDEGPRPGAGPGIPSTGMVTGAVQVPPDGRPIILMPDHATVGGYPVACCVIAADLPLLGQLGPGDTVSFTAVDPAAARRARQQWERALDERVSGWFPTAAGT
jgi:KipI family sensor histidine kinase inhibitor